MCQCANGRGRWAVFCGFLEVSPLQGEADTQGAFTKGFSAARSK